MTSEPDSPTPPAAAVARQVTELARDLALTLPNLAKLVVRLLRHPQVPLRSKLLLVGIVAYIVSPLDLIPDSLPVVGLADEVFLTVYALDHLIRAAGQEVVAELWDGPDDVLETVESILGAVGHLVPEPVRRFFDRVAPAHR